MKHAISILLLLTLMAGCGSPSKVAYKTLDAVGAAENSAMRAAAKARHNNQITADQWKKVADVHHKFVISYNTAVDLAAFDKTQPVPPQVSSIITDLITLLNECGVQLNL